MSYNMLCVRKKEDCQKRRNATVHRESHVFLFLSLRTYTRFEESLPWRRLRLEDFEVVIVPTAAVILRASFMILFMTLTRELSSFQCNAGCTLMSRLAYSAAFLSEFVPSRLLPFGVKLRQKQATNGARLHPDSEAPVGFFGWWSR